MESVSIVRALLYSLLSLLTALGAWVFLSASGARQDAAMIALTVGVSGLLIGLKGCATKKGRA